MKNAYQLEGASRTPLKTGQEESIASFLAGRPEKSNTISALEEPEPGFLA